MIRFIMVEFSSKDAWSEAGTRIEVISEIGQNGSVCRRGAGGEVRRAIRGARVDERLSADELADGVTELVDVHTLVAVQVMHRGEWAGGADGPRAVWSFPTAVRCPWSETALTRAPLWIKPCDFLNTG